MTHAKLAHIMITDAVLERKRTAVHSQIGRVASVIEAVADACVLDHALTTLTQLATTLEANSQLHSHSDDDSKPVTFVSIVQFSPAEKSETQMRFTKTTNSAGRRQKMVPLK